METKLNDDFVNYRAIGTDVQGLLRKNQDVEGLYRYIYDTMVERVLQYNEKLHTPQDVEKALKGYRDDDGNFKPKGYLTPEDYKEDTELTEYRKLIFRKAQLKLLFEILQGRLSREAKLEQIPDISHDIDQYLFYQLRLYNKPEVLR